MDGVCWRVVLTCMLNGVCWRVVLTCMLDGVCWRVVLTCMLYGWGVLEGGTHVYVEWMGCAGGWYSRVC